MHLIFCLSILALFVYLIVLSYNPERVYFQPHFYESKEKEKHFSDGLSILTYNASTAHIRIFGIKIYEPIPFYKQRFSQLPFLIEKYSPDVIAIQETYKVNDKEYLISSLKNDYPFSIYYSRKSNFKIILDCGLVILSKYPIIKHHFELFKNYPFDEGLLVRKGFLHITLSLHGNQISIINTHLTVGGLFWHTESKNANMIRKKQIQQIVSYINSNNLNNIVFSGDFNSGPNVSSINYNQILENNFFDPLETNQKLSELITWDPENLLNKKTYFENSPPQRVDHVFIDKVFSSEFYLDEAKLFGLQPIVAINKNQKVTLSDHYGILLNFKKIKI